MVSMVVDMEAVILACARRLLRLLRNQLRETAQVRTGMRQSSRNTHTKRRNSYRLIHHFVDYMD